MIDYFKYTNGESFTLSGEAYQGLFNIQDGKAFSGKSFTDTSKLLSGNNMFLADAFLEEFEFDRTVSEVKSTRLKQPFISPRNVVDQNFIDRNLQLLHLNNLNIYALSIIANPNIFDFLNSTKNGNAYFLGLSSGTLDLRNNDTKLSKTNEFPIQIDPFKDTEKVPGVEVLDDTLDSELFIYDDESFFYFITTPDTTSYTFSGSFVTNGSLIRIEDDVFKGASKFSYDNNTDTLYAIEWEQQFSTENLTNDTAGRRSNWRSGKTSPPTSSNAVLKLYDSSFINPCRVFKQVNQISLHDQVVDERVGLGNNIMGYRYLFGDEGPIKLKLLNKNTYDLINIIGSGNSDERILSFDIRDTDDSILVLTLIGPLQDAAEFYVYHLDIDNVTKANGEFILPNNPGRVLRHIPAVEFKKKQGVTITFLSNDSNMFIINDQGAVSTRFISNPENVASFPSMTNLLYLPNMFFDTTYEKFNLIEKKFNSNLLPSNTYNNLSFHVVKNNSDLFYFLHNIGRIYLVKESTLPYKNLIPLNLKRLYEKIVSCESSIGISINSELQTIIKDAVTIFLNASIIPHKEYVEGIPVLSKYVSYDGLEVNFRNFEFHENEELNYNTVSRVFDEIYKLQLAVFNIMVSGTRDDGVDGAGDAGAGTPWTEGHGEMPTVTLRETVVEDLYTAGGLYRLEGTTDEFIGFYHIHPVHGAMVGPKHTFTSHEYLVHIGAFEIDGIPWEGRTPYRCWTDEDGNTECT